MLIGMSTFSQFLAKYLYDRNFEVIAVDSDEGRIEAIKPYVTKGIVGDAKDDIFLRKAGVQDVDSIIISLGRKADDSLLVVYHLLELKVKNLYVKVISEDHAKILKRIGECKVIFPERESALKLAQSIDNPNVLDYIPLAEGYSIINWSPSEEFVGQSLADSRIKTEFGVQVISIRDKYRRMKLIPDANYIIAEGDLLVVLGQNENLEKLKDF